MVLLSNFFTIVLIAHLRRAPAVDEPEGKLVARVQLCGTTDDRPATFDQHESPFKWSFWTEQREAVTQRVRLAAFSLDRLKCAAIQALYHLVHVLRVVAKLINRTSELM